MNTDEYFKSKGYLSFLTDKLRRGQLWKKAVVLFEKIRKYTFISSILRAATFIIALLEKSAVLLLIASILLILLPFGAVAALIYILICRIRYIHWNKEIREWLINTENITVFITKEHILSNFDDKMFLRCAKSLANTNQGAVIIVCSDAFIAAKWYSFNLLAIKEDYFFILKRRFIEKKCPNSTFIVL